MRILITAGPTREYIDTVRYLSNASSGKMGFAIATAARRRGHKVTVIHGPVETELADSARSGVVTVPVVSAADMLSACKQAWPRHDVLIMSAAVADYSPAEPSTRKLKKSTNTLVLELKPTTDILATLSRTRSPGQLVIGFALEDRQARSRAEDKLRRKNLDAILLNHPSSIGSRHAKIEVLIRDGQWQSWPSASKSALATRIIRLAESFRTV